jgi:hypothetical protein
MRTRFAQRCFGRCPLNSQGLAVGSLLENTSCNGTTTIAHKSHYLPQQPANRQLTSSIIKLQLVALCLQAQGQMRLRKWGEGGGGGGDRQAMEGELQVTGQNWLAS